MAQGGHRGREVIFGCDGRVFGTKLYEMQTGFAVMFNLMIEKGLFPQQDFQMEMTRVEGLPEIRKLREVSGPPGVSPWRAKFLNGC